MATESSVAHILPLFQQLAKARHRNAAAAVTIEIEAVAFLGWAENGFYGRTVVEE